MANEGLAVDVNRARQASWIDEAVLLAFLLLAFVGLSPFAVQTPAVTAFGQVGTTGAGDLARQLCYLAVLGAIVIGAVRTRGIRAASSLPVLLVLLLAWCLLSALWSGEPGVTLRRAGLAVVLVISAMLSAETVGAERSLVLWRWVLAAVLIVNLASIHFIPQAVHLPGEADTSLVGDWRGLYGHKNIAGSVGAMTAIIFLFTPRASPSAFRKLLDVAIAVAAVGFTVMTRSKSSLGLLAVALVAGARLSRCLEKRSGPHHRRCGGRFTGDHDRGLRAFGAIDGRPSLRGSAGIHRPHRDLGGRDRLYPRSCLVGRGLRHLLRHRRNIAAAQLYRQLLGGRGQPRS